MAVSTVALRRLMIMAILGRREPLQPIDRETLLEQLGRALDQLENAGVEGISTSRNQLDALLQTDLTVLQHWGVPIHSREGIYRLSDPRASSVVEQEAARHPRTFDALAEVLKVIRWGSQPSGGPSPVMEARNDWAQLRRLRDLLGDQRWPWPARTGLLRLMVSLVRVHRLQADLPFVAAYDPPEVPVEVREPTKRGRGRPPRLDPRPALELLRARFRLEEAIAEHRTVHCDYHSARPEGRQHRDLTLEPLALEDHGYRTYLRARVRDWAGGGRDEYRLRLDRLGGDGRGGIALRLGEPGSARTPSASDQASDPAARDPFPAQAHETEAEAEASSKEDVQQLSDSLPQVDRAELVVHTVEGDRPPFPRAERHEWDPEHGHLVVYQVPRRRLLGWLLRHIELATPIAPIDLRDEVGEALERIAAGPPNFEVGHHSSTAGRGGSDVGEPAHADPDDIESLLTTLALASTLSWNGMIADFDKNANTMNISDHDREQLDVRRWLPMPDTAALTTLDTSFGSPTEVGALTQEVLEALQQAIGAPETPAALPRIFDFLLPLEAHYVALTLQRLGTLWQPLEDYDLDGLAQALLDVFDLPGSDAEDTRDAQQAATLAPLLRQRTPIAAQRRVTPGGPVFDLQLVPQQLISDRGHVLLAATDVAAEDGVPGEPHEIHVRELSRIRPLAEAQGDQALESGAVGTPPEDPDEQADGLEPVVSATPTETSIEVTLGLDRAAWWVQDRLPPEVWSRDRSGGPIEVTFAAQDPEWVVSTVFAAAGYAWVVAPDWLDEHVRQRAQDARERLEADVA